MVNAQPCQGLISHVLLVAMLIPLAAQSYEINPFGWMSYAMARPTLRERIRIIICKCERSQGHIRK